MKENEFTIALTGSGAMSTAKFLDVPFIQEVVACKRAVEKYIPQTDVVIELGGEDAKIIYFGKSIEQRMNGICAGGTGSFIDQMASLLQTDATGLNEYAKSYQSLYTIAARCGVFAKSDIQPLINDGAMTVLVCANSQVTIAPGSGASLFTLGNNTSGSIVINKKNTVVLLFKVTNTIWFALVPGVQDGQVSGSDIAPGAVDTEQLAEDSVTLDKMADNSVDTDQLVDGAVTPEKTTGLQKTIYAVDATLSKNSWSNKSLTVSGISKDGASIAAGDGFVASPNNANGWKAAADAMLYPPSVGDGTLTFTCETVPKDDIPITVYFWKE